jgi:hypothetical protein
MGPFKNPSIRISKNPDIYMHTQKQIYRFSSKNGPPSNSLHSLKSAHSAGEGIEKNRPLLGNDRKKRGMILEIGFSAS